MFKDTVVYPSQRTLPCNKNYSYSSNLHKNPPIVIKEKNQSQKFAGLKVHVSIIFEVVKLETGRAGPLWLGIVKERGGRTPALHGELVRV